MCISLSGFLFLNCLFCCCCAWGLYLPFSRLVFLGVFFSFPAYSKYLTMFGLRYCKYPFPIWSHCFFHGLSFSMGLENSNDLYPEPEPVNCPAFTQVEIWLCLPHTPSPANYKVGEVPGPFHWYLLCRHLASLWQLLVLRPHPHAFQQP